ncbi:hypothetical protein ACP70R_003301 [Stipagrostis hirtigluma subsp. patula]
MGDSVSMPVASEEQRPSADPAAAAEEKGPPSADHHKRKLVEVEAGAEANGAGADDGKRPRVDGGLSASGGAEQQDSESSLNVDDAADSEPGRMVSRRIRVPNRKVVALIGRAGCTIRDLQVRSGANIQFPSDFHAESNAQTWMVELSGTLQSVDIAEQFIKSLIAAEDGRNPPMEWAPDPMDFQVSYRRIQVPNRKVGALIGNGVTIKNLQLSSGAKIQFPNHFDAEANAQTRPVDLFGTIAMINKAEELIKSIIDEPLDIDSTTRGFARRSTRVDRWHRRSQAEGRYGRRGQPLWRGRQAPEHGWRANDAVTDLSAWFSSHLGKGAEHEKNESSMNVDEAAAAQPGKVAPTKGAVDAMDSQVISRRIQVPNRKVAAVIGKCGHTIRDLELSSGAKIVFPNHFDAEANAQARPVELSGTLESIDKAEKLIKSIIAKVY